MNRIEPDPYNETDLENGMFNPEHPNYRQPREDSNGSQEES
jgi:hypothetical protein